MRIADVHDDVIHLYDWRTSSLHKISSYNFWWPSSLTFIGPDTDVVFFGEDCFSYYFVRVKIYSEKWYSRSDFKELLHEKLLYVQSKTWSKLSLITYKIKNKRVDGKEMEFFLGEKGYISFDICYYILDEKYADITRLWAKWYPRWYFLLSYQLVRERERSLLLSINKDSSSLLEMQYWWYHKIHLLNVWDDLLWQAYEQCWLNPEKAKYTHFESNTLARKLLEDSHTQYTDILSQWMWDCVEPGADLILTSRLINQPFFVDKLSESYMEAAQSRVVPFNWLKIPGSYHHEWKYDELPIALCLSHFSRQKQ